jgi:uncharacterized protein YoxC
LGTIDFMWLAIGVASLGIAGGVVFLCVKLGRTLERVDVTLTKVDRQLDGAELPLLKTLDHIGGVADSLDELAAKINRVGAAAERAAEAVADTAGAAQAAVTPTVANLAGIVAGVAQGAKAFFRSRADNGSRPDA